MADYDKDMAEERIQIKNDKNKIYEDDKKKRDTEKGPKTFEGGAHRGEMKHDKEGNHLGPKQYDDYGAKGHGAHKKDYGTKMTADPQSYRSSMSRHWSGSNSRFLTEGGDVIDQTAQRDSM